MRHPPARLIVDGGTGDLVLLNGAWTDDGTTSLNGGTYRQFDDGGASVFVNQQLDMSVVDVFNSPVSSGALGSFQVAGMISSQGGLLATIPPGSPASREISTVGDINADGYDDMFLRGYSDVVVHRVRASWSDRGFGRSRRARWDKRHRVRSGRGSVARIGDVNNDGLDDMAYWGTGASGIHIVFGHTGPFPVPRPHDRIYT